MQVPQPMKAVLEEEEEEEEMEEVEAEETEEGVESEGDTDVLVEESQVY